VSPRATVALNYALYQAGWVAAVGGAALGLGTAGAAVAALLTAVHLALARDRRAEAALVAATLVVGLVVESGQIAVGTYATLGGTPPPAWPPPWLLGLWGQFATTFRFSAAGLFARPWAAALFGAIGGPAAFLAGERLGAVTLTRPLTASLIQLVVAWAIGLAVCGWLVRVLPASVPAAYRRGASTPAGQRGSPRSSAAT
jgi:Protein of unknown function (DUF2878)